MENISTKTTNELLSKQVKVEINKFAWLLIKHTYEPLRNHLSNKVIKSCEINADGFVDTAQALNVLANLDINEVLKEILRKKP